MPFGVPTQDPKAKPICEKHNIMSKQYFNLSILLALSLTLLLAGCKGGKESDELSAADSIALAKARQDSLAKAMADSLQLAQEAEQAALREAEMEAQRRREALRFHVILGSFRTREFADSFLALQKHSYPDAKMFTAPNGFLLVSIGDFDSMHNAVAFINRLHSNQDEPEDMWVFEEGGVYDTSAYLEALSEEEEYYY